MIPNLIEISQQLDRMFLDLPVKGGSCIYFPKKHKVMSWAAQRRSAKKRRRSRK